jgi:hypothetical protein
VARTAVAAGTFTAVSNRVSRRQAKRWAAQDQQQYQQQQAQYQQQQYQQQQYQQQPYQQQPYQQQPYQQQAPPPAAPAAPAPDRVTQLKDLADLKAQGILTEEEFAAEKARVLGT